MNQTASPRRPVMGAAIVLIVIGLLFLYFNLRPDLDPWPLISRYWPLILIFVGVGKVWDYFYARNHPDAPRRGISGGTIALLVLAVLLCVAIVRGRGAFLSGGDFQSHHEVQTLDRQGAQSVTARLDMPAGELNLSSGASHLLEATFDYSSGEGKPRVQYSVAGERGSLDIDQTSSGVHLGRTHNTWELRFANDVPLDIKLNMGAGQGELHLGGLSLTSLDVNMGAGQLDLDLTGDWKKDLQAAIHGGVGEATIRLPKNVGVRVHATGGIGSINTGGLLERDGAYVNEAYGKSPVTLRLTVEGGIGTINLESQD